jgi:competence protein ComEC
VSRRFDTYYAKSFVIALVFLTVLSVRAQPDFGMKMHVINIGQGDSILLEFQRHAVLVDTGGEDTEDQDRYKQFLTQYLDAFFQRRADLQRTLYGVVLSHPHIDHGRQLMTVLENYNVQTYIEGGSKGRSNEMKGILSRAKTFMRSPNKQRIMLTNRKLKDAKLLAWTQGIMDGSQAEVRFLSGRRYCSNENNDSLAMRVQFGQKSFLLVGDWETEDEPPNNCGGLIGYLRTRYKNTGELNVDVYKVGHHGSYNGTSKPMLDLMTPDFAVISAGKFNDQGPGGFHAFQFAHPRGHTADIERDSLLKIIAATQKTRSPVQVYYLDKVRKNVNGVMKTVTERFDLTLGKAVYCTCWDDNIVFTVNTAGNDISVTPEASPST